MAEEEPWWRNGMALWPMAFTSLCLVVSQLLADPHDSLGGPVLHFAVLGGSGALLTTAVVLLVLRRRARVRER